jgi:hypothetical protein
VIAAAVVTLIAVAVAKETRDRDLNDIDGTAAAAVDSPAAPADVARSEQAV